MSAIATEQNICPNCNTPLQGEFCYECGQKRIHHPETVTHFVRHFFDDITHFDSKFFKSLLPLLFKPGLLTKEYMAGRRASYLHPIRAYLFLSFVYFLLFFSVGSSENFNINLSLQDLAKKETIDSLKEAVNQTQLIIDTSHTNVDSLINIRLNLTHIIDSLKQTPENVVIDPVNANSISKLNLDTITLAEYTSLQNSLPESKRDNWLRSLFVKKSLSNKEKYNNNGAAILEDIESKFLQSIPKMLFFLLPVFVLLLKLLYVRHSILFISHAIFSLHYFSFIFITFSLTILLNLLVSNIILELIVVAIVLFYLYKSMVYFYHQSRSKTIIKLTLLMCSFTFAVLLAFAFSMTISFLTA